jgi:hypothetical protein
LPDFIDTIYQNVEKKTNFPTKLPNDDKIYKKAIKYTEILNSKAPKNTQIGVSGNPMASGNPIGARIKSHAVLYYIHT